MSPEELAVLEAARNLRAVCLISGDPKYPTIRFPTPPSRVFLEAICDLAVADADLERAEQKACAEVETALAQGL